MRKIFILLISVLLLIPVAGWERNPYGDSVDGTSLAYQDHSGSLWYYADYARDAWEVCCDGVDIFRDTAYVVEDVGLYLPTQNDVDWDGLWSPSGADSIFINNKYWKDYGSDPRKSVMVHEFGHALGLGEETGVWRDQYYNYNKAVMYPTTSGRKTNSGGYIIKPTTDDKNGFNYIW